MDGLIDNPYEREDEARRAYYEFDAPEETYDEYLQRYTQPEARLSERPRAGIDQVRAESSMTGATPGTGRSESREEAA